MFEGLYKCEYHVDANVGRSVMYVHGGSMLGGNSAFAHIGSYSEHDGEIMAEIESRRHNHDPNYTSLLHADVATIQVRGREIGHQVHFTGGSPQLPGARFRSVMTPLEDDTTPDPRAVGEGGIANGLYAIDITMLDGLTGGLTGVLLLHDGRLLGGDAFFYYLGSYTSAQGRWKGEILNQEHTPSRGAYPIFAGHQVGIGFSGSCDASGAQLEATALVGKRSLRFSATLALIRAADRG